MIYIAFILGLWTIGDSNAGSDSPVTQAPVVVDLLADVRANPVSYVRYQRDGKWVYIKRSEYRPAVKKKFNRNQSFESTGRGRTASASATRDRANYRRSPVYASQYRSRGDWSWPGDLRTHLAGPPHYLNREACNTWSHWQLIDWHNAHHEKR